MNNKTIEETLQPYIEKAIDAIAKGSEFAIDAAPELIQEFYRWHTASAIALIILSIIGIIGGIRLVYIEFKIHEGEAVYYGVPGLVLIVGFSPVLIANAYKLLYILVSPKLYLINYFLN